VVQTVRFAHWDELKSAAQPNAMYFQEATVYLTEIDEKTAEPLKNMALKLIKSLAKMTSPLHTTKRSIALSTGQLKESALPSQGLLK